MNGRGRCKSSRVEKILYFFSDYITIEMLRLHSVFDRLHKVIPAKAKEAPGPHRIIPALIPGTVLRR